MIYRVLMCLFLATGFFTTQANACANHLYFDPEKAGLIGGTLIKMAGLAPPEKVFKLKHPPAAMVAEGEEASVTIDYERPWFSKDVRLQLSGTKGIELLDGNIELPDFNGTTTARFRLTGKGINAITLTVRGEHKGKIHEYSSRVYVRAKKAATPQSNHLVAR